MTNVPTGAGDRYFVYRPILDLIGLSEGTDKARGYNETLAYGAYTGGPVDLVKMTLKQLDELQGRMLAHPKNKWKSSACGRYQIVRTTRRTIQQALSIPASALFDRDMQDRMACYLLGGRGIDKWLSGRLSLETLLDNLAREWASLPTSKGKGFYSGQNASVSIMQVSAALSEVKRRHTQGQPKLEVQVPVEVEKPVVPESVETKVKEKVDWWTKLTGGGGVAGLGLSAILGVNWQNILAGGAVLIAVILIFVLLRSQIGAVIRDIRGALA